MENSIRVYSRTEELIHALTHLLGAIFGLVGLVLLICKTVEIEKMFALIVYGVTTVLLFSCSFIYHFTCYIKDPLKDSRVRDITEKFDHCAIFFLIMGTYFPPCLNNFAQPLGGIIISIVAVCSIVGIVLNVISVTRFAKISLILYVMAGWTVGIALFPFYKYMGLLGLVFLILGGVSYTIGIVFYKLKRLPYMHVIWHVCVLLGAVFHYFMIYFCCT